MQTLHSKMPTLGSKIVRFSLYIIFLQLVLPRYGAAHDFVKLEILSGCWMAIRHLGWEDLHLVKKKQQPAHILSEQSEPTGIFTHGLKFSPGKVSKITVQDDGRHLLAQQVYSG